jgi:hypothetical protein
MGLKARAAEHLRKELAGVSLISGGEVYVPAPAAGDVFRICDELGFAILGVEGFVVRDDKVKPDLDLIADFSSLLEHAGEWESLAARTREEAQTFVQGVPPSRHLNFTVVSEEEFRASSLS